MSNFLPSHPSFAPSQAYGAPSGHRQRKPPVSDADHKKVLEKNRWLRDEDRQLSFAYDKKMGKVARKVFRKLARIRDSLRKRAMNAVIGHAGRQVAGRTMLALSTAGISELVRLTMRSRIDKRRKKVAEKMLERAHAADVILRYWRRKFVERLQKAQREGTNAQFDRGEFEELYSAIAAGDQLEVDGAAETLAVEPGDEPVEQKIAITFADMKEAEDEDSGLAGTGLTLSGAAAAAGLGVLAGLFI